MTPCARAIHDLARQFGPQGWWPIKYAKTPCDRACEVAIGAILTQNTAWRNVETALACLAEHHLLSSRAIFKSRLSTLERCIRSSGYFRQKAKKLKQFATCIEHDLHGDLRGLSHDKDRRARLLAQWGIGPETADTILLYGLYQPIFVVDAYTRRFLASIHHNPRWLTASYIEVQAHCEASLPRSVKGYQEAHALIVAWGKSKKVVDFSLNTAKK